MKSIRRFFVLIVGLLIVVLGSAPLPAQQANIDAAKKEGKIVVYGSVVPQAMEGLHQAFKKKYGVDVEYWRGSSTQVSERALTEWRAGKPGFDIAEGNRGVQLIMKDDGLFAKFIPPASEKFPCRSSKLGTVIAEERLGARMMRRHSSENRKNVFCRSRL